jgi:diguanylate cyclase (GGDEF)-like protein
MPELCDHPASYILEETEMWLWQRLARRRDGQPLPADIYISLVDALFKDFTSLIVGSLAASITALITAWKTGEQALYLCSLAMVLVACVRARDVWAYRAQRPQLAGIAAARQWELRYVVGAAAHVFLMGVWCLLAFAKTSDTFVQFFSFSLTLAYMIGISGRNFASNLLVSAQIVCAGIPMTLALFSVGGAYYTVFAFVLVPFFASLKLISDRLRRVLLDAVVAGRDVSLLAGRFDTALNNMPHGLCMFDGERRVAVCNKRLAALLGLAPDIASQRPTALELIEQCVRAGTVAAANAGRLLAEFESGFVGAGNGEVFLETVQGRTLALTFHPMADGGAVVLFEDITDRRVAEAKIDQLARYDALTGLPNRALFRDQMDAAVVGLRRRGPFAIHFIDLDEFKQVNDTLGHPCGDELLCVAADRLRAAVRGSDIVARFGGDEFVVLQYPLGHPKEAGALAERIVASLAEPFQISGNEVVIGASIGIALGPRDGSDADLLLKNADMALYRAKSDGRRAWRFFEHGMDVMAQARRNLQLDLRNAVATRALQVHYQPLFNLHTKRISTCEALLRWPHPVRGMIPPAEFIPVAEEMGLIVEIGNFVLHEACSECTKWPGDVRVAVNMSAIQFRRSDVAQAIRDALDASGLPASRLEIEITESVFLNDTELTRHWLDQLQEMGVTISLDDFGTGYSSLSYLHTYPLDKVKIDRSFLQGVSKSQRPLKLLHGVARLSADLGMSVTVEGVETEEQLALVARERCVEEVQGWLFGAAMPAADIRQMLLAPPPRMSQVA